jgi:hypothetical protein
MKICIFGDYDPKYSRNRVLIEGLKAAGAELFFFHIPDKKIVTFLKKIFAARTLFSKADCVLVMYSESRTWVPLLRLFTTRPVVWDAFFSRYDAIIHDRGLASPYSIKAWYHWFLDFLSVRLSTYILLDTDEHIRYFMKTFGRSKHSYIRVLVGALDPRVAHL